jgi:aminoglycoside/choline kinase family phosphotransferase
MLQQWLAAQFSLSVCEFILEPLTGDAGFRQYYRFFVNEKSYIAVDAPNDKSNNLAFIEIQQAFSKQSITVPELVAVDQANGFFCLSDFGDVLLADVLTPDNMSDYYQKAIDVLPIIAIANMKSSFRFPIYDRDFISNELAIFTDWLIAEHLQLSLTVDEEKHLGLCFEQLIDSALQQPQVVMHRDYHSRNIMLLDNSNQNLNHENFTLGIIDFQDAVIGPITYDIVSLLRDCYVRWPDALIKPLFKKFYRKICKDMPNLVGQVDVENESKWQRWFDFMGLQRHIKASGIFARLHHRDKKSSYLKDIPLTLTYIQDISALYPELTFLHSFINSKVLPALLKREKVD